MPVSQKDFDNLCKRVMSLENAVSEFLDNAPKKTKKVKDPNRAGIVNGYTVYKRDVVTAGWNTLTKDNEKEKKKWVDKASTYNDKYNKQYSDDIKFNSDKSLTAKEMKRDSDKKICKKKNLSGFQMYCMMHDEWSTKIKGTKTESKWDKKAEAENDVTKAKTANGGQDDSASASGSASASSKKPVKAKGKSKPPTKTKGKNNSKGKEKVDQSASSSGSNSSASPVKSRRKAAEMSSSSAEPAPSNNRRKNRQNDYSDDSD